jgi:spermidine/putrescine ABC transporter ATP-binding subunit
VKHVVLDASQRERGIPLSLVDLSKSYGTFQALDQVSLDVPAGTLLTLLGPSGCGKSTLLRIIAGFVHPSAGRVLLNGQDVVAIPPFQRQTAMVFQSYALFPHMRVQENVMFGLRMRKVDRQTAKRRVGEALEMVRMSNLGDRYPSQLSGGQQQRAALARALVTDPKILLLDEPFGALDKSLRDEMQVELRKLQQSVGVTTICVTHDQQEAMTISDRIAVMRDGRIEQFGTPLDVYDAPRTRFVAQFVGTTNILSGVVQHANGHGCRLRLSDDAELSFEIGRPVQAGQQIEFAVRPSTIRLRAPDEASTAGDGEIIVEGKIAFNVNLGSKVTYEIDIGNEQRLFVEDTRMLGARMWQNGQPVAAVIARESCVVLES